MHFYQKAYFESCFVRLVPINMFKPSICYFTDCSKVVLLLWILFVIYVSCFIYFIFVIVICCLVCSLQPFAHMLGNGRPLGSLACDIFLCFAAFPYGVRGSGVVLDCIDS